MSAAPRTSPRTSLADLALAIVEGQTVAAKLAPLSPAEPDIVRGRPRRPSAPGRPPELAIASARTRAAKVPPVAGMGDPVQRARILHALANHELQAVELFAWALLAFPDAPARFRRGLCAILGDEQRHLRLYLGRVEALGHRFGDFPVTGHFWNHLEQMQDPRGFVCVMGLTFENANLDFAQDYARAARAAGDADTARVLDQVHADEIRHVRFAWRWLEEWRDPGRSGWQAYRETVKPPLGPARARGRCLCRDSRRAAGLDDEFIGGLAAIDGRRPGGAPR